MTSAVTGSITLNLLAAVRTIRAALPAMLAPGHGTIVTISSVSAFLPDPTVIDYGAAKAALTNFAKSLSKEVRPRGLRVNTISPGPWPPTSGSVRTASRPPSHGRAASTRTRSPSTPPPTR
jgi:NAD(P)-dependent dehydrogenase (short-subunit alcohol dehydrogenase family)